MIPPRDRVADVSQTTVVLKTGGLITLKPVRPLPRDLAQKLQTLLKIDAERIGCLLTDTLRVAAVWIAGGRPESEPEFVRIASSLREAIRTLADLNPQACGHKPEDGDEWKRAQVKWLEGCRILLDIGVSESKLDMAEIELTLRKLASYLEKEGFGMKEMEARSSSAIEALIDAWESCTGRPAGKGFIQPESAPQTFRLLLQHVALRAPYTLSAPEPGNTEHPQWSEFVSVCSELEAWKDALARRVKR